MDAIEEERPGARVLLLLPAKYLRPEIPNHTSSTVRRNRVSESDWELIRAWKASNVLYVCDSYLYDDWYWMYATVAETQAPEPDLAAGQTPGVTLAITNDAMRDHWNDLLPSIAFHRWRHSQVCHFGCHGNFGTEADAVSTSDGSDSRETAAMGKPMASPPPQEEAPAKPATDGLSEVAGMVAGEPTATTVAAAAANTGEQDGGSEIEVGDTQGDAADDAPHPGLVRMLEAGLSGPLRTWVAPVPTLSVEGQIDGGRIHIPVPGTTPQEWLCISLPIEDGERP